MLVHRPSPSARRALAASVALVAARVIRGVASPADIGLDTRRRHLVVPRMGDNCVEIWTIPPAGAR
jgi:hypothetical protein